MFVHLRHTPESGTTWDLRPGVQEQRLIDLGTAGRLTLVGDPVQGVPAANLASAIAPRGVLDPARLLASMRGHYYWFLEHHGTVTAGTSFAALFPLYIRRSGGTTELCSSMRTLAAAAPATQDHAWLLERLVFNYPLFDRTPWREVRLLPAHTALHLGPDGVREERYLHVRDLVDPEPRGDRASLDQLCGLFATEAALFLPDERVGISFTGGFDGRTLLAAARHAGHRDLFTYSFGMPGEEDLTFPQRSSAMLGIEHLPITLDADYVERHAARSLLAFMDLSEHNGNLGRPHYHHAAEVLAQRTRYLLTGNFGSELFRALHQPGVMMSATLVRLFAGVDQRWKDDVGSLAGAGNGAAADEVIADAEAWLERHRGATAGVRFHTFVLEELFRKYFGPELVVQAHVLRNRTPYLSLPFLTALNATRWAAVHSMLFEGKRVRRMKGQVFYAAFLRRMDPELYRAPTNKGYSPADVLEPLRAPLLVAKVLRQRFRTSHTDDSNAVRASLLRHGPMLTAHYGLSSGTFAKEVLDSGLEHTITAASAHAAWHAAHGDHATR